MLKGNINKAVELALLIAPRRHAKESLTNVSFSSVGGNLVIHAFDGEAYVTTKTGIPCKGEFSIQSSKLANILRTAEDIEIKQTKTGIVIRADGVKHTVQTPECQIINPPEMKDSKEFSLTSDQFNEAVNGVSFAVDDSSGRFALSGVEISIGDEHSASLVGTDGKRLACWQSGPLARGGAICPVKYLKHAARVAGGDVTISTSDNLTRIETGPHTLTFMNVSGRFPDWSELIQPGNRIETEIEPELFLDAARKATALIDESTIDLYLGDNSRIECSNSEGSTVADITGKHGDYHAKFNGSYLVDSLARFSGKAQMFTGSKDESLILKSGLLTHILMPVHNDKA